MNELLKEYGYNEKEAVDYRHFQSMYKDNDGDVLNEFIASSCMASDRVLTTE